MVPPPTAPSPVLATPGKQAASKSTQPAPSTGLPPTQSLPTQSPPAQSLPAQSPPDAGAAPPVSTTGTPGPVALAATKTEAPKWTSATLSLPFPPTVGVAAFRRGGSALVVFDERRPIDLSGVRDDPVFGAATIQLLPAATVLRLPLPANRSLAISQASQSWRLAVIEAATPAQPIPMRAEDGQLSLPVDAASEVVAIADPETGATLLVGTQLAAGQGFPTLRQMPDFSLLPTWQGVVIAPLSDRVELRVVNSGFMLTGRKPGLAMSPSSATMQAQVDAAGMTRRFDLRSRPLPTLVRRLREQVVAAAMAAPLTRGRLRQATAETMIALGLAPEAQAMLQLATADDPALGESADAIGLGAIAALLAGRVEDAGGIDDPRLTGSDEVALWRAVRAAEITPGSPLAATGFAATVALIDVYPQALRRRLLPLAFETMIEGGQAAAAARLLGRQGDNDPALTLARGMLRETNGDTDGALAIYDALAAGRDRLLHARAAVRAVELRLSAGRIDVAHAADALDRLLYAWRGDRRELALRERLADLREQTGAWRVALALLRDTEEMFPDDKDAVHARLKATFARLLHDDALDRLAPLELVALVEENADLLPDGPAGEALEERLADRLVELDLPRRAASVLEKLTASAPSPAGRAGFAARLAVLRLREHDPSRALAALAATTDPTLPLPLIERRALLAASAHAELGDTTRAVEELAKLGTATADLARATILEQAKDWPGAERALADYVTKAVPPTGIMGPAQQRTLVRYATAAAQAGDDGALALLRTRDGPRMPTGPFGDMFRLLTAEPVHVTADLPRAGRETALAHDLPKALDALKPPIGTP